MSELNCRKGNSWTRDSEKRDVMKTGSFILGCLDTKNGTSKKKTLTWVWPLVTIAVMIILAMLLGGCENAYALTASWYSRASLIKEKTAARNPMFIMANGKVFYDDVYSCACNSFKLGTRLLVTAENGKSVVVVVTDRTAKRFTGKRVDLSAGAFRVLAPLSIGLINVNVEVI